MKVVLDTNVLIDGLKDEYSYEKRIINEVIAGQLEAFANKRTLQENQLLSKQLIESEDYQKILSNFFGQLNNVAGQFINVVRDSEDNKILASALAAKADYLITSDKDLLEINAYQGVKIVTPQAFWARYADEGGDLWSKWASFVSSQKKNE